MQPGNRRGVPRTASLSLSGTRWWVSGLALAPWYSQLVNAARRLLRRLLFVGTLTAVLAGAVQAEDLRLVKDLETGAVGSSPTPLGVLGGYSYFAATSSDFGTELWRSDGTAEGTTLFKDLLPGPGSSDPQKVLQVGDVVYFLASDRVAGRELW